MSVLEPPKPRSMSPEELLTKASTISLGLHDRNVEAEFEQQQEVLEQCRATGDNRGEALVLCATAELHLGLQNPSEAVAAATKALLVCRGRTGGEEEAASLAVLVKAHWLLDLRAETGLHMAHELLGLIRELGSTWSELGIMLSAGGWHVQYLGQAMASQLAAERLQVARSAGSRIGVAVQLSTMICAQLMQVRSCTRALTTLSDFLTLCRDIGAIWREPTLCVAALVPHNAGDEELTDERLYAALQLVALDAKPAKTVEDAIHCATEARAFFEGIGLREGAALALIRTAHIQLAQGQGMQARHFAESALHLFKELKHQRGKAVALQCHGRAALLEGKHLEAQQACAKAFVLSRACGDRRDEAAALHTLAQVCVAQKLPHEALCLGNMAGQLLCHFEDGRSTAALLSTMSAVQLQLSTPDSAISAAQDALLGFQELGDKPGIANAKRRLAEALMAQNMPQDALLMAKECLEKFSDGTDQQLIGDLWVVIAKAHAAMDEHEEAVKVGTGALERFKVSSDKLREAAVSEVVAKSHLARHEPDEASQAASTALKLHRETAGSLIEQEKMVQTVVQAELMKDGRAGVASDTTKDTVARLRQEEGEVGEAIALQAVAQAHIAKKEYLRAAREAKNAQRLMGKLGNTEGEVEMVRTVVQAHLARPDSEGLDDALHCLLDTLEAFRDARNATGAAMTLRELSLLHVRRGEPERAVGVVYDAIDVLQRLNVKNEQQELLCAVINQDLVKPGMEGSDEALRAVKAAMALCQELGHRVGEASLMLTSFRLLRARAKPQRALQAADEAVKTYRELGDVQGEALVLQVSSQAHLQDEEFQRAFETAQQALGLFRELRDRCGERAAMQILSQIHLARDEHMKSMELSTGVLQICRVSNDERGEAAALQQLARAHLANGGKTGSDVALKHGEEALALFRSTGDVEGEMSTLQVMARAHLACGQHELAETHAKAAGRVASRRGDKWGRAVALNILGDAALNQGRSIEALQVAEEALEIFRKAENADDEASQVLTTIVNARLINGEPSEALRTARAAHEWAKRAGSGRGEASALLAVASVCLHIRAPKEAAEALWDAQGLCRKLGDRKREANALAMLTNVHLLTGNVDSALRSASGARSLYRGARDRKGEAEVLEIVVHILSAQSNLHEARASALAAAQLYKELGESASMLKAHQIAFELCIQCDDFAGVLKTANDALVSSQHDGLTDTEGDALLLVAQAHMMQPRPLGKQDDVRQAVEAADRARGIFAETGDKSKEMEALHIVAQAHLARGNKLQAVRCAEERLRLSQTLKDRLAEANAQYLCATVYTEQDRLTPAIQAATIARDLFRELGIDEGLQNTEYQLECLQQIAETRALQQHGLRRASYGRKGGGSIFDASSRCMPEACTRRAARPAKHTHHADQVFNRKSFPWTAPQAA